MEEQQKSIPDRVDDLVDIFTRTKHLGNVLSNHLINEGSHEVMASLSWQIEENMAEAERQAIEIWKLSKDQGGA